MMLNKILSRCDARYEKPENEQCEDCSYGECCPHDCEKCLDFIHDPSHAPEGAPDRKYDCTHMADFYTCKYSCRYTSEIMYALELCKDLQFLRDFKVLSFGCGPCTDLFAIDALRECGVSGYDKIEYRGIDYSRKVWNWIHGDIESMQSANSLFRFYYQDACRLIHEIAEGNWVPNLVVFQYVFSDMQKHSSHKEIDVFINTFAEYFNSKVTPNAYIILNDVNLGCGYGGGREYFDKLLSKLDNVIYKKGHFHNDHRKGYYAGGYPYGEEFPKNTNRFDWSRWKRYSPFDTCASAQMIIKKVVK